jgi:hypothetical protein
MRRRCTKEFEYDEYTVSGSLNYRIVVYFHGQVVDTFEEPTMNAALFKFEMAGYRR